MWSTTSPLYLDIAFLPTSLYRRIHLGFANCRSKRVRRERHMLVFFLDVIIALCKHVVERCTEVSDSMRSEIDVGNV